MYFTAPEKAGRLEVILNYKFNNQELAIESLHAERYTSTDPWAHLSYEKAGNKNLAEVGEAVIQLMLVSNSYEQMGFRGPLQDHANNEPTRQSALSSKCRIKGIEPLMINGPPGNKVSGPGASDLTAITMKAVIGAVFLDSSKSITAVDQVMRRLWS